MIVFVAQQINTEAALFDSRTVFLPWETKRGQQRGRWAIGIVLVFWRFAGTRTCTRSQRFPNVVESGYWYHFVEYDRGETRPDRVIVPRVLRQGAATWRCPGLTAERHREVKRKLHGIAFPKLAPH